MVKSNKEKAVAVLKSLETDDKKTIKEWISPEKYIQHNLGFSDGRDALLMALDQMEGSIKIDIKRAIEDDDFVVLHSEVNFFGPKVSFDIFRFEDGKIVEHWDNLQETVEKTKSGHSMIDGPTEITDTDKTETNKALLKELVEDVFIGGQNDKMSSFFDDDNYIQHNPKFADGLSGLLKGLEKLAKDDVPMKFTENHMILGEGNFVLSVSEGNWIGKHVSFYDLFRIENGKFVEHWDVIEKIPPQNEWENQNGKF
ncbi:MAG TPA: nuclear transport factor 2 family protein [Methanobacterium sp.]|nr:nuclear transport factor 2 family protein [Methanobacterium sp.]